MEEDQDYHSELVDILVVNGTILEASIEGFDFANHIENWLRVHTGGGWLSAAISAGDFSDYRSGA